MVQVSGFGFRIIGGREEGSQATIGGIVAGGAADLDGRVQVRSLCVCVCVHGVYVRTLVCVRVCIMMVV